MLGGERRCAPLEKLKLGGRSRLLNERRIVEGDHTRGAQLAALLVDVTMKNVLADVDVVRPDFADRIVKSCEEAK